MADRLDVNVLVTLFVPEHQHHFIALNWFSGNAASKRWATCTDNRVGRDSCLRTVTRRRLATAVTADRVLMLTVANPGYLRWPDVVSPATLPEVRSANTGNQVTDRYLLGLARRNRGRIVTFDRALAAAGGSDVICLSGREP